MEQSQIDQGIRLKQLIKVLNINQLNFSKSLGIPQPNISKMMNGERQLNIGLLNRISERYKVDLNWLVTGNGEMFLADEPETVLLAKEDQALYQKNRLHALTLRLDQLEQEVQRLRDDLQR